MKVVTFLLTALLVLCLSAAVIFSADHRESLKLRMAGNGPVDLNDIYVFVNGSNLVMAMTVSPFAQPGAVLFDPNATYNFFIDTNGDGFEDLALNISVDNAGRTILLGDLACKVIRVFAGRRDDPFFFDPEVLAMPRTRRLGTNMFGPRADVGAIVLELPLTAVTPNGPNIGVWAETRRCGEGVLDRTGRPGIATVFVPLARRDEFNLARPGQDIAKFQSLVPAHVSFLLPDILTIDTSKPTAYPNGRALADDVIDVSLKLILQNQAATDSVANDSQFLNEFPFLGPPQVTSVNDRGVSAPLDFDLFQSYPNPFNPSAKIEYALPVRGSVILKIYNLLGVEVRTLVDATQTAGQHAVTWDGKDNLGRDMASGIYLYRLEAKPEAGSENFTMSRRMVLMR
jgi:hypothetical protein